MTDKIVQKYLIVFSIIAFCIYQYINFFYFPLNTIFPDESRFVQRAIVFSQTNTFGINGGTAWEMPLTSIIFGYFYKLFGSETYLVITIRLLQSCMLILQAYLLYKISLNIFKNKLTALLTFIIVLLYPYFIYYQALLLSETIFNTFLIISFYYIYMWYKNDFKFDKSFILANIFLILSIYVKATLSLLVPLLMAGFYFFNTYNFKTTFKILLYSSIIYILFLSPWWIRNYNIFNTFIPFTTTSSLNLYLGNNPYNLNGGCDWSKDVDLKLVEKLNKITNEVEKNKAYNEEAIKFIKQNPDRFFELALLKLKRFYSIVPNAEAYSTGYYKWISIISYGPILILFLISILVHIKLYKQLMAIYLLIIYFTLIHMVVIASLRYRLPIEPFMILLSMPIVSYFIDKIKTYYFKKDYLK